MELELAACSVVVSRGFDVSNVTPKGHEVWCISLFIRYKCKSVYGSSTVSCIALGGLHELSLDFRG